MGGINSNKPPAPTRIPFEQEYHKNRPAFRATGMGLMVDLPNNVTVALTKNNANGILEPLVGIGDSPPEATIQYLFIDSISTEWSLSGSLGQSQEARSFYPRNMIQGDLVITGTMPNQYEYDKLVEFVLNHQKDVVQKTDVQYGNDALLQVKGLKFTFVTPEGRRDTTYHHGPRLIGTQFVIVITNIKAGHERFKFAPSYTLTCKVIDDRFYGLNEGEEAVIEVLEDQSDYMKMFGQYVNPSPREQPNFLLEPNTQRPKSIGTAGISDASDRSANDFAPGDINSVPQKWHAAIAASAPALTDPTVGNQIKQKYPNAFPPDPGKQYFAAFMNNQKPLQDNSGNWILRIKYRNPPNGSNTESVPIDNP